MGESGEQITSYPIAKTQISTSPSHSVLKYIAEGEKKLNNYIHMTKKSRETPPLNISTEW